MLAKLLKYIETDGHVLEHVFDFIYLGSTKTFNGDCKADIARRIGLAKSKMILTINSSVILSHISLINSIRSQSKIHNVKLNKITCTQTIESGTKFEQTATSGYTCTKF